jgi:hypothetical protein
LPFAHHSPKSHPLRLNGILRNFLVPFSASVSEIFRHHSLRVSASSIAVQHSSVTVQNSSLKATIIGMLIILLFEYLYHRGSRIASGPLDNVSEDIHIRLTGGSPFFGSCRFVLGPQNDDLPHQKRGSIVRHAISHPILNSRIPTSYVLNASPTGKSLVMVPAASK